MPYNHSFQAIKSLTTQQNKNDYLLDKTTRSYESKFWVKTAKDNK
jgi:hypothetical protein